MDQPAGIFGPGQTGWVNVRLTKDVVVEVEPRNIYRVNAALAMGAPDAVSDVPGGLGADEGGRRLGPERNVAAVAACLAYDPVSN